MPRIEDLPCSSNYTSGQRSFLQRSSLSIDLETLGRVDFARWMMGGQPLEVFGEEFDNPKDW
ncbi:BQ5605_C005g03212 [Microbotryum silenes-dioicae]|uniref:BQ5605_C005g03212 protein n=1 Tax=Microbotryum silenes-dioicae TaxID=796604 RepID=A0A2X0MA55_9BASI|nr:BQ5605_C005g03212 [Microbotryum silenes-dioicae]